MAEPPPELSVTPPGTPLSASPRYHHHEQLPNTSMEEDPHAEGARTPKRQRVDSGSGTGKSSDVPEILSIEAASAASAASSSAAAAAAAAAATSVTAVTPSPATNFHSPAKVTINMKSPTSELPEPIDSSSPTLHAALPQSPSPNATPTSIPNSNAVSASAPSSPEASPQIEIADPEDMEQDSNHSNWRPLEEIVRRDSQSDLIQDIADMTPLVDLFPRVRPELSASNSVARFIQIMDKGDMYDAAAIIQKVQTWMDHCARNLDLLTLQTYVQHEDFWSNFPTIVEFVLRRKTDLPINDGVGLLPCLKRFLLDYVQITLHLIEQDSILLQVLADEPDQQTPESMSKSYLQQLGWLVSFQSIPLYGALDRMYGREFRAILLDVRAQTLGPLNAASKLSDYCALALELTPKHPQLVQMLFFYLTTICGLLDCTLESLENTDLLISETTNSTTAPIDQLYTTLRSIDLKYQEWITKKSPWATSDISDMVIGRQFPRNLQALCRRGDEFLRRLSQDMAIDLPDHTSTDENTRILLGGWKFGILKKHFMEGRMELRVHGVDKMQAALVDVWKEYISQNPDGISDPFVQYLVRFIKENKIVDYLVGVDSHPQLIGRSSNIVGFLVVTSTYTDRETDVIWKAVTESQDSRIVSEVLSMLTKTFYMHTTASPALLYLCEKLSSLPLDKFDAGMLEFCDSLLGQMTPRHNPGHMFMDQSDTQHAHAIPLRLCVRMIRESTVAEDLSADQRTKLQSFGSRKLSDFIKAGIGEDDRMEMYERCIQDIAEMNQFTTGSIQALSALVPQWDASEMRKLATDFDLTRLVINDMLHTVNGTNFDLADCFSQHGLVSRVEILSRLINQAPETVTPELGSALWNQILLSSKLGPEGHRTVWAMMVNSLSRSAAPNSFLDQCIHEHMPHLAPKDYDFELLLFAKQSVNYEIRFKPPPAAGENEIVFIPGMDRIWDIILTTPPGTVEADATKFAIEVYLDHQIIQTAPRSAVDATHVSIVGRCVKQLKSAAATINARPRSDGMATNGATEMEIGDASESEELDELMFTRSLLFLHQLLEGLRTRPRYSPPQGSPPTLPQRPLRGSPLDLRWQSFRDGIQSQIQSLRIGDDSTAAELTERLTQLTGFSKFSTIAAGARLDLFEKPDTRLKEIKALQAGLLIIRKSPDAEELQRSNKCQSLTSVDSEVMKYFDDIYEFLALSEPLAEQTFTFLTAFPPNDWVLERVKSQTSNANDLFPFDRPYIAFYMFHTLLHCIEDEATEVSPNYDFIRHSIDVLRDLLMADNLSKLRSEDLIISALAMSAVDLLLRLVSMCPVENDNRVLFAGPQPLIKRLLNFIDIARSFDSPASIQLGQGLTCNSFAVLVEASLRDHTFWTTLKDSIAVNELVRSLLLEQPHQLSRNDVAERIKKACGLPKPSKKSPNGKGDEGAVISVYSTENPSHIDMLATIWQSLVNIIPNSLYYATQSAELFKVALSVFQSVTGSTHCDATLNRYVDEWSEVLFQRLALRTEEFVGRETVDHLVFGIAVLLEQCLETADLAQVELHTTGIGEKILSEHLFPSFSPDPPPDSDLMIEPRVPVLHSATRHKLLSIVYLLSKQSDENTACTIKQLDGLIPRGQSNLRSLRCSNILFSDAWNEDHQYNGSWIVDRAKTLRAPEGYAGLTNLSNTCYLNSLMTQLFMNVEFRDFILKLKLVESDTSQRLLDQTQKVFALMQNSWLKSVDPIDFVESIRTYDNEAIDVTIQMDVDEFYNLLFDRCEAQIVAPEEKKRFRSFYGGQLVQQIKSKECPHISERLEPFSAIQCDIKGKASLEESLQAYVEGEIMQGDNKYSCTSCGRHVDAVKRACLKDVPDNLIFHLKRFDFDMVTMLRSKINDQFQFPDLIDMTPYNVEYLSEPEKYAEPDIFELVGVLVHTGTAESGHYYSYTRERPSTENSPSWVEFNDADVSTFDPTNIADQCFGGQTEAMHNLGGVPMNKLWSAYMLFYQRVSSIEKSKQIYKPAKPGVPVRASVPIPLANQITMENEVFIRAYCLLDPLYASLVVHQLRLVQEISPSYPDKQTSESLAVSVGLDTFEQLIARNKGHMGAEDIVSELHGMLRRSPQTASRALWWFCEHPTSIGNLVLKTANADAEIRQRGLLMITSALKLYQKHLSQMDLDDSERKTCQVQFERIVENIVDLFEELWPNVLTVARAWDDYFDFFSRLAQAGMSHVGVMLDHGILVKCLDVLWLDHNDKARLRGSYLHYSRLVEKGRRFSYGQLMHLCTTLVASLDFSLTPVLANEQRILSARGKYAPNVKEAKMLLSTNDDGYIPLLMKLFQTENFSELTNTRYIIESYLQSEPGSGFLHNIVKTLENGLRLSPVEVCIPYLDATLVFCQKSPDKRSVLGLIDHVAKGVESINNVAGLDHLEFFIFLCKSENERAGLSRTWFNQAVQDHIPDFAPTLFIDTDRRVRNSTYELVDGLLFVEHDDLYDEAKAHRSMVAHELVAACLLRISHTFTESSSLPSVESRQVSAITSAIRCCLDLYYDDSEQDLKAMEEANQTLLILDQLTVEVADDFESEESDPPTPEMWENTSPLASDDEIGLTVSP